MTRQEYFNNMKVKKTNSHWCSFCDKEADFIIEDNNSTKDSICLCNKCAELFKQKIQEGIEK